MLQSVHYTNFVPEEFEIKGPFHAIDLTDLLRQDLFKEYFEEHNRDLFPAMLNSHFLETISTIEHAILTRSPAANTPAYDNDDNMVYLVVKIKNEIIQRESPYIILNDSYEDLPEEIRSKKMCVYLCVKAVHIHHNYEAYSSSSTLSLDYILYIDFC